MAGSAACGEPAPLRGSGFGHTRVARDVRVAGARR